MSKIKVNNRLVPDYWKAGIPANNHTGSFTTDGDKLWSYSLLIGDTCERTGTKVLREYTAGGKWGYKSQTTSCHVGYARCHADIVDG